MEKMMMPAYYNVLSTEEMTYTEGGATMVQAACAWFIPFYGWFKGITAVRDYRKKNPNNWTETGLDALSKDMEKSTANLLYDIACAASVVGSCPGPAPPLFLCSFFRQRFFFQRFVTCSCTEMRPHFFIGQTAPFFPGAATFCDLTHQTDRCLCFLLFVCYAGRFLLHKGSDLRRCRRPCNIETATNLIKRAIKRLPFRVTLEILFCIHRNHLTSNRLYSILCSFSTKTKIP